MQYDYNPNGELEKFAVVVYKLIAEKFPQTFFVGGMVRDLLLQRPVTDIDIATEAHPDHIISLLQEHQIEYGGSGKQFGVVIAKRGDMALELATFRSEEYQESRFPKVRFIKSAKEDSQRRDFTINALYFNYSTKEVIDFHNGEPDIEDKIIKFIGDPETRIKEDPLRIVRAYRFQLNLNFKFDFATEQALTNLQNLTKTLSKKRIENEINKISDDIVRQELRKVIHKFT